MTSIGISLSLAQAYQIRLIGPALDCLEGFRWVAAEWSVIADLIDFLNGVPKHR